MSTVQEIEAAIRLLGTAEREELLQHLPVLLPELDGDAAWDRIIHDARPRPTFTAMLDEVQAEYQRKPGVFPVVEDGDFD